jgi:hypothetical protein
MKLKTLSYLLISATAMMTSASYAAPTTPTHIPVLTINVVNRTNYTFTETTGYTKSPCTISSGSRTLQPKATVTYTCKFQQGFLLTTGTYHADYGSISGINTILDTSSQPIYQFTGITSGALSGVSYSVTGGGATKRLPQDASYAQGPLKMDMTFNIQINK